MFNIYKISLSLLVVCILFGVWFVISEIYTAEAQKEAEKIIFEVKSDESVGVLADRLESERVIRSAWFFKKYLAVTGKDKKINIGEFSVESPITLSRVVEALGEPGLSEESITIIPGWNIRDISGYLVGLGKFQASEVNKLLGLPAVKNKATKLDWDLKILQDKPDNVSYEGYLAPDTYRIYKNASLEDIIKKLMQEREDQITDEMWKDIGKSDRSFHEILTMASILESEARDSEDMKKIADIFWRRYDKNWALQADSTVHYAVNKSGNVFTTSDDRAIDSLWNTYKYPGLPPSPICNPSLEAIEAAIYPDKNNDWYFLTGKDGTVYYAETLEEHNTNKKYLY